MITKGKTAVKEAARIWELLRIVSLDTYPVDVEFLIQNYPKQFDWDDAHIDIKQHEIDAVDGFLVKSQNAPKWLIGVNSLCSEGRRRFTLAHEFGHYLLHRSMIDKFHCSAEDLANSSIGNIEYEANLFASVLLIPYDDLRINTQDHYISKDLILELQCRYNTSITALLLQWLRVTSRKAILTLSNDGFMRWAVSSDNAMKAGLFFRTTKETIPMPTGSNVHVVKKSGWFEGRFNEVDWITNDLVYEVGINSEQFGNSLTLFLFDH